MNKKMNKHIETILKKQCKMVGADFDKMDFKKEQWFWLHEWTDQKQEKFKQWLIEYIKKNSEARKEIMQIPSTNKRILEGFANEWIFQHGWKQKERTK